MHPTVKPVALIADAIRDCTRRNDIVLDPFAGSGSMLIAADQCGRRARLIELDPLYCDTIIRRLEKVTGEIAWMDDSGTSFSELAQERVSEPDLARGATGDARSSTAQPGQAINDPATSYNRVSESNNDLRATALPAASSEGNL